MDSMIGYTNDKYILFGRTAAKLDDVLNFIPARIFRLSAYTGSISASWGRREKCLAHILKGSRKNDNPNSAHGEAACAGALHLRLAGDAWYFGVLHKKSSLSGIMTGRSSRRYMESIPLMFLAEGILMAVLLMILAAVR